MKYRISWKLVALRAWIRIISILIVMGCQELCANQMPDKGKSFMESQSKVDYISRSKSIAIAASMLSGYSSVTNNALHVRCYKRDDLYHVVISTYDGSDQIGTPLAEVEVSLRRLSYMAYGIREVNVKSTSIPLHPIMGHKRNTHESIDLAVVAALTLLGQSGNLSDEFILDWNSGQRSINVGVRRHPGGPGMHTIVVVDSQGMRISPGA